MTETTPSVQYSIVIPVYNTSKILAALQQRIEAVFTKHIRQSFEIILVDDRSPNPATWPAIQEVVQQSQATHAIRLGQNVGQHTALLCGLAHAKGAYIITMDDDLQHAPEDIPLLIAQQEHAVVMGQFQEKQHAPFRNFLSWTKAYFDRILSGKPQGLRISTFCVLQRSTLDQMLAVAKNSHPLLSSLIFAATQDVVGVEVQHSPRQEGQSGYSFFKMTQLFGRLLLNNMPMISRACNKVSKYILAWSLFILLLSLALFQETPNWVYVLTFICLSIGLLLFLFSLFGESLSRPTALIPKAKAYIIEQHIGML